VIVNAASMRTSGRRICKSIHDYDRQLSVILIVEEGMDSLKSVEAEVVLAHPFTLQKLLNRIRLLAPPERGNLIIAGPVQFDPENNWVRCHDRQSSLTPRLTALLRTLMERPGEIIERSELFKRVWETTYMGDTRTMDVHISWLRQAIEEDPRHPQFIKTMRGVGYRFEVNP
ncbi:MAG: response regulator transcription factor, partial [Anaerolineaceae bacterium]